VFSATATITTNGTGAGVLNIGLPTVPASTTWIVAGRDTGNGKMCQGTIPGPNQYVGVVYYDNTYPGRDGATIVVSGAYQST
jgi:hypothetical protein